MDSVTLRPGLLVRLATSIKGNTSYKTFDLGTERQGDGEVSKWDTERTVKDRAEQDRAVKARSAARGIISRVCIDAGELGLLCLRENRVALLAAEAAARAVVREFNDSARVTRLRFNLVTGEVAENDASAVRAINQELSDLMESMAEGMKNLDSDVIRDAANRARNIGQMLTPDVQERVQVAIDIARKTARQIVKAGETGALEVDKAAIARIAQARTMFLDLDEQAPVQDVEHVAPAVDFEPMPEVEVETAPTQPRMFDL